MVKLIKCDTNHLNIYFRVGSVIKQLAVFFVALAITEAVYINYPYENNENLYGNVYPGDAVAPIVAIPVAISDYSGLYNNEEHSHDYYVSPNGMIVNK